MIPFLIQLWYHIILERVSAVLQSVRRWTFWLLLVTLSWIQKLLMHYPLLVLPSDNKKEYLSYQIESMRASEATLMEFALRFSSTASSSSSEGHDDTTYDCQIFDTKIDKSCISSLWNPSYPLQCQLWTPDNNNNNSSNTTTTNNNNNDVDQNRFFLMHGVRVQSISSNQHYPRNTSIVLSSPPLVLIHGYAGGAFYFYRNIVGLASHVSTVYSIDLLGWGLSSRPEFYTNNNLQSVESTESFFVESLERWRQTNFATTPNNNNNNNNDDSSCSKQKIILAAHSIGAYLSVAYCEKYPQYVEQLILVSPVGVLPAAVVLLPPKTATSSTSSCSDRSTVGTASTTTTTTTTTKKQHTPLFLTSSYRIHLVKLLWYMGVTPGMILRSLPEKRGRALISNYIRRRFFAIQCEQEKESLCNYLYTNLTLPGSGEYSLNRLLKPIAIARKPTVTRIPKLSLSRITFIYGEHDWMDINGGLKVQQLCEEGGSTTTATATSNRMKIDVLVVRNSGHLPMLENWEEFNIALLTAIYGEDYLNQHYGISTGSSSTNNSVNPTTTNTTTKRPLSLHYSNFLEHTLQEDNQRKLPEMSFIIPYSDRNTPSLINF